MLKEIDLIAFGRRVHIYNAIKELKGKRGPQQQRSSSILSPAASGYEPDSPGFASPAAGSYMSAAQYQGSNFGGSQNEDLQGPGLDDDNSSMARPSSSLQRSASGNLTPQLSKGTLSSSSPTAATHKRSATGPSAEAEPVVEDPIPEETETESPTAKASPIVSHASRSFLPERRLIFAP